jgi:hypothetical protein
MKNRQRCITTKLPSDFTGLKGSVFCHVDYTGNQVAGIRFSQKHKEDTNTLDLLLTAQGDAVNASIEEIQGAD